MLTVFISLVFLCSVELAIVRVKGRPFPTRVKKRSNSVYITKVVIVFVKVFSKYLYTFIDSIFEVLKLLII